MPTRFAVATARADRTAPHNTAPPADKRFSRIGQNSRRECSLISQVQRIALLAVKRSARANDAREGARSRGRASGTVRARDRGCGEAGEA
ncbi:hypothetical protein GCM10027435_27820 [Haloparvum alkalitolerans]